MNSLDLISALINLLVFMLGASLGSFANVIADRYRVKKIANSRSECLSCSHVLTWYELIPVLSYLIQGGKCRNCKSKLSPVYLWGEIFSGLALVIIFNITVLGNDYFSNGYIAFSSHAIFTFLVWAIAICLSVAILIYDLRHKVVPAAPVYALIAISIIYGVYRYFTFDYSLWDLLSGFVVALPYTLLYIFSRGKWVGLGDVLIYFAFGTLLGIALGSTMFFASIWLGAIVMGALLITHNKEYNLKSEIPFTPFIIIAAIFTFIINYDLLSLNYFLK